MPLNKDDVRRTVMECVDDAAQHVRADDLDGAHDVILQKLQRYGFAFYSRKTVNAADPDERPSSDSYWWLVTPYEQIMVTLLHGNAPVMCVVNYVDCKKIIYAEVSHRSSNIAFSDQFVNCTIVDDVVMHVWTKPATDKIMTVLADPSTVQVRKVDIIKAIQPESATRLTIEGEHGVFSRLFRLTRAFAEIVVSIDDNLYEWDVAAGHTVVLASGGTIKLLNGDSLLYGNMYGARWKVPDVFIARR